jgi:hypothetical protein
MIIKFQDYLYENRNLIDRNFLELEDEFRPNEPVLQNIYDNELEKLYHSNINKYRLILNILKINKKVKDKMDKKPPNFTYFKSLLKLKESELKDIFKHWVDLNEEDWYMRDLSPNTDIKI